jgi:hypothetical protein
MKFRIEKDCAAVLRDENDCCTVASLAALTGDACFTSVRRGREIVVDLSTRAIVERSGYSVRQARRIAPEVRRFAYVAGTNAHTTLITMASSLDAFLTDHDAKVLETRRDNGSRGGRPTLP